MRRLVYIVHSAEDRALAGFLKSEFEARIPGLHAFVASYTGQIPTGADWLNEVRDNLRAATTFLLLLTPRCIDRRWVWYEAGVAWARNIPTLPVVAAGLTQGEIPLPHGLAQALALEVPEQAQLLFTALGGTVETPEAFCDEVKQRALSPPTTGPTLAQVRAIRQAFGALGKPPRLVLKGLLESGGMTFEEIQRELLRKQYVSDPLSVQRMVDTLTGSGMVERDADGRLRVRPDFEKVVRLCVDPTPGSQMEELADEMVRWADGQGGSLDMYGFEERFRERTEQANVIAVRLHSVMEPRLMDLRPRTIADVKRIAEGLVAVSKRVS